MHLSLGKVELTLEKRLVRSGRNSRYLKKKSERLFFALSKKRKTLCLCLSSGQNFKVFLILNVLGLPDSEYVMFKELLSNGEITSNTCHKNVMTGLSTECPQRAEKVYYHNLGN